MSDVGNLKWFKSTRSEPQTNDCVELAGGEGGAVHVRDSKDPAGAVLSFTQSEFRAFLGGAKAGEFDALV